jgi:hypothetical protein
VYQLLVKAVALYEQLSDVRMVPVLICRRGHKTLFRMERDLGFHVIGVERQLLPHSFATGERAKGLAEVRGELAFTDLLPHEGPFLRIRRHFDTLLFGRFAEASERWHLYGSAFGDLYERMRDASTTGHRRMLADEIRAAMAETPHPETGEPGVSRGW